MNNYFNQSLNLYWVGEDITNGVLIAELPADQASVINTFNGHKFYATPHNNPHFRVAPGLITITKRLYFALRSISVQYLSFHERLMTY